METSYYENIDKIAKEAIESGLLSEECSVLEILNLDFLKNRVTELKNAFYSTGNTKFIFGFAIKSNPITNILKYLKELDCGAECASLSEVEKLIILGISKSKMWIFSRKDFL